MFSKNEYIYTDWGRTDWGRGKNCIILSPSFCNKNCPVPKLSKSKNKSEVSKVVSDVLKRNGLYILPDYFKSKDTSIITEPKQHSKEIRMLICQLERFANDNEVSGQILEKITKNMESDNYFDFMSMPILATLVHFTPDKMSELKERITKVITELL